MLSLADVASLALRVPMDHDDLRVVEAKCGFCLVDSNLAGYLGDVSVKGTADVIVVAEDESLLDVKSYGYDVLCVPSGKLVGLFRLKLVLEEELLVIYQRRECLSEGVLQQNAPVNCTTSGTSKTSCNHLGYIQDGVVCERRGHALCEHEGNHMAQVHAVAARPSSGVQEPRFALLIAIQNLVEVTDLTGLVHRASRYRRMYAPMREEHPSPEEDMRTLPRQPLKPLKDRRIHSSRTELVDELVVVNRELLAIVHNGAFDVPGGDDLSMPVFLGWFYCGGVGTAIRRWYLLLQPD